MKVLIYEPNGELQKFLMDYMIRNKITPQVVDRETSIFTSLASNEFDIFLTDYTLKEELINDIIFNLKLNDKLNQIKIFITTSRPEKDVLQTLIQLGVNGFIKKPFTHDQFHQAFDSWMKRNSFHKNKRVHSRITPAPADNAFLYLRPESINRDIPCEIIDLSVGGVGVALPRSFERLVHTYFPKGEKFKNVRFKLRQVSIRVHLEVVGALSNRLSLKFVDNPSDTMKYIFHYIADNLR